MGMFLTPRLPYLNEFESQTDIDNMTAVDILAAGNSSTAFDTCQNLYICWKYQSFQQLLNISKAVDNPTAIGNLKAVDSLTSVGRFAAVKS